MRGNPRRRRPQFSKEGLQERGATSLMRSVGTEKKKIQKEKILRTLRGGGGETAAPPPGLREPGGTEGNGGQGKKGKGAPVMTSLEIREKPYKVNPWISKKGVSFKKSEKTIILSTNKGQPEKGRSRWLKVGGAAAGNKKKRKSKKEVLEKKETPGSVNLGVERPIRVGDYRKPSEKKKPSGKKSGKRPGIAFGGQLQRTSV